MLVTQGFEFLGIYSVIQTIFARFFLVWKEKIYTTVEVKLAGTPEHGGKGGSAPPALKDGDKSALLDLIVSHFLLTFVLLSGSISFYPQDFVTYHEMQQSLVAHVYEK